MEINLKTRRDIIKISECQRYDKCSAPICPLDKNYLKRAHPDGERSCGYLQEYAKPHARTILIKFEVISEDEHNGEELYRFYNVTRHFGRAGKGGLFKIGLKSDFAREHINVFGEPKSFDQIAPENYQGKIVVGNVRTVVNDSKKGNIAKCVQYSTISELISLSDSNTLVSGSESEASFKKFQEDNEFQEKEDKDIIEDSGLEDSLKGCVANIPKDHYFDSADGKIKPMSELNSGPIKFE